MRKHLIKIQNIKNPFDVEIYTTLTGLCSDRGMSYDWLKTKKFPFDYKGYRFEKLDREKVGAGFKY